MKLSWTTAAILLSISIAGCNQGDTPSTVNSPGNDKTAKTAVLEAGAAVLQSQPPVRALDSYLDGFHFYSGDLKGQMEAHHYCSILNDDLIQCVIYDGNLADAKLMGVEYIVSEKLFTSLPAAEKSFWHSHVHEVKSGQLIAPGIPEIAEHELMEKLIHTYGKTWHTWHTDLDKELPLGAPQLMMGFTADGQADRDMVRARDQRFGIDSNQKKKNRADMTSPPIDPGADSWQQGRSIQIADPTGKSDKLKSSAHGAGKDASGHLP
jgi:hypothetical protein